MRIGILTHFQGYSSAYALHVGWHERMRLLARYGVDFEALVWKKCPPDSYPNQINCLPNVPSGRPFEDRVKLFSDVYREVLEPYDVILTADLIYQRKGNFLAWNQAMKHVTSDLKAWWCHWIHSSWTTRPSTLRYPDSLRYEMMDRSYLVYLSSYELPQVAKMYDTKQNLCYPVYNPKDPRSFFEFDPLSWKIIDMLDLTNKQAIQIFPVCSTRMEPKGIDTVIHGMAALKRAGLDVGLVIANANARQRQDEIKSWKKIIYGLGLVENEDYLFTSDINENKAVSRKVIRDIFRVANIFWFGSWRETTGNIFQEAQISGNLLVLNKNIPCLQELSRGAIMIDTSFKTPGVADGRSGDLQTVGYQPSREAYYDEIVDKYILPRLPCKQHMWTFSFDYIWKEQFKPLLERAYVASNGGTLPDTPLRETPLPIDHIRHVPVAKGDFQRINRDAGGDGLK